MIKHVKNIQIKLSVITFKEGSVVISYAPALDIAGYGNTIPESTESLHIALNNYIQYAVNKNTLIQDLKERGWKIKKSKPYIAPVLTELIKRNDYLHDIVNEQDYKVKKVGVSLPEYA